MATLCVVFGKLLVDEQQLSPGGHMIATVLFGLVRDGKDDGDYAAVLKQAVGDNFEPGAIEVTPPMDESGEYNRPIDHAEFSKAVEAYYMQHVGPKASTFPFAGGKVNENLVIAPWETCFEVEDLAGGPW
jgi:hypothetical protein